MNRMLRLLRYFSNRNDKAKQRKLEAFKCRVKCRRHMIEFAAKAGIGHYTEFIMDDIIVDGILLYRAEYIVNRFQSRMTLAELTEIANLMGGHVEMLT
jgi:hypothetical protein